MSATGLRRRAARGVAWNYATFALSKLLVLVTTAVLARLLSPDDFGLMALGLLVLTYLDHLNDAGVAQAVIYRRQHLAQMTDVAFTLGFATSVGLGILIFTSAPPLSSFFGEPDLTNILRVLAVAFVVSGLRVVPEARLKRDLAFRHRVLPETVKTVAKGGIAIGLAFLGYGVWSLVWGQLAGNIVSTALYWRAAGIRPRWAYDPDIARKLLGYGIPMVLVGLLGAAVNNLDYVVVGRRMTATQLGLYTLAFRLPELVVLSVTRVISDVMFPVFASQQDDRAALRDGYLTSLRYIAMLTLPLGVGLALVAEPAVLVLFSAKWEAAIPVLRRLAIYATVLTLGFTIGDVYKGIGRPWLISVIGAIKLVISAPVLWLVAEGSIVDVANAMIGLTAVFVLAEMAVAARVIALTASDFLRALWRPTLVTCVMSLGVVGVQQATVGGSQLVNLVVATAVGVTLYAAAVPTFDRAMVIDLLRLRQRSDDDLPERDEDRTDVAG